MSPYHVCLVSDAFASYHAKRRPRRIVALCSCISISNDELHSTGALERPVWPVVNVGLDLGDVVDLLGQGRQLGRLKVHPSHFLGKLL